MRHSTRKGTVIANDPSLNPRTPARSLTLRRLEPSGRVTMANVNSRRHVAVPVTTLWTSPNAPRDVDAAAVGPQPDVVAWLADLDAADARLGLHGRVLTRRRLGVIFPRVADDQYDVCEQIPAADARPGPTG